MFAGRYVWWLLTGTALFLLALFGFDSISALTLAISGCSSSDGSCYDLSVWMMSSVKPVLVTVTGAIIIMVMSLRMVWLRFLPLWIVPVLAWGLSIAAMLRDYRPLWRDGADIFEIAHLVTPSAYAFVALAIFLAFPLENEEMVREKPAPVGLLAGFAAMMVTLHVLATASGLPIMLIRNFQLHGLGQGIADLQAKAATFMQIDGGNTLPGLIMVALFALSLALRIVRHEMLTVET